MIRTLTVAALLWPAAALAQDGFYISSLGDEYAIERNDNGAVLRSRYPKAWIVGAGSETRIERGTDVIYLGTSCDAFHAVFGDGTWTWANGGFRVEFADMTFRFPRQETGIDNGLACGA